MTHTHDSIERAVRRIVSDQLGISEHEVTPAANFVSDLGADSLDTIELAMAYEEEFGVNIPDEDAETLERVTDAVTYLEARLCA